jgi:pantoate--beta-alanine ligase
MQTATTLPKLRSARAQLQEPVGLVPTMGFLHEGHLSLVRRARSECASVVVSIFVNPTQFGPKEDLSTYPRDVPRDLALLEAEGVDLVWAPLPEVMYPPGFQTWVTVEKVTQALEGVMRPGHFRGVTTIVAKLFTGVQPQKAYFGQKDAQQSIVIGQMVRDLNFPIQVVVCPTVRETDGLALSSRNSYLDPQARRAAGVLYRGLTAARAAFDKGERDGDRLRQIVTEIVAAESLVKLLYISCANPETLQELETVTDRALLSLAALLRGTRLIDNILLQTDPAATPRDGTPTDGEER